MCFTLTYMNYCESDVLYQQSMLHTLKLLSCLKYHEIPFLAKTVKMANFQYNFEKRLGW